MIQESLDGFWLSLHVFNLGVFNKSADNPSPACLGDASAYRHAFSNAGAPIGKRSNPCPCNEVSSSKNESKIATRNRRPFAICGFVIVCKLYTKQKGLSKYWYRDINSENRREDGIILGVCKFAMFA